MPQDDLESNAQRHRQSQSCIDKQIYDSTSIVLTSTNFIFLLYSDDPKWKRIGEAHLSYYASAYKQGGN